MLTLSRDGTTLRGSPAPGVIVELALLLTQPSPSPRSAMVCAAGAALPTAPPSVGRAPPRADGTDEGANDVFDDDDDDDAGASAAAAAEDDDQLYVLWEVVAMT